jgi:1-aminocyclopropane-1-carboxylate deaminase/D-cysteine desulfhydrase-like pyridoxal-dependent ACC family enzyme
MMSAEREQVLEEAIGRLPRIPLGVRPTPLEAMPRLSETLGGPPLYIKRDDLTGLAFGGNKTRMLEFSLADAQAKGTEVIVTGAAVQSNYCRQIAAACAKLGLELRLFLRPEREIDRQEVQGNHLLHRLFGARVTIMEDNRFDRQRAAIAAEIERLRAEGRTVYYPRREDTVDLDAIAYAEAALLDTTQAGLVLGLSYLESSIRVKGFSPFQEMPERTERMAQMANQAAQRLGLEVALSEADFDNDDSFVGERYGVPTEAGIEALRTVARCEGILLDPVYTGKAMSALFAHMREGVLSKETPVVFVHTGGAPALFAYAGDVLPPRIEEAVQS